MGKKGFYSLKHPFHLLWLTLVGYLVFPGLVFSLEVENAKQESQSGSEDMETQSQQETYRQQVKTHIQKTEELLSELLERVEAKTGEEREILKRTATKINAELEHAKRMFENFERENAEQWLRNKTELNAVMANLDVAYDQALPYLRDKLRLLQEAIERTGDALFYKDQKDLFNRMTQSGLKLAEKALEEGLRSEFIQEGISRLKNAREHFSFDNREQAIEAARSAYHQLNSALKHYLDTELQN